MSYHLLIEIRDLLKSRNLENKEVFCFEEAVDYLKVSKSFLYKMTSSNSLTYFKPSGKLIYFKKSDLDEWLLKNKIEGTGVFEKEVESYLNKHEYQTD